MMRNDWPAAFWIGFVVLAELTGCSDYEVGSTPDPVVEDEPGTASDAGAGDAVDSPGGCLELDSSFAAIQHVIFEDRGCTAETCHGSAKMGELDLRPDAAYASLVDATATGSALARVQPGTAIESYLYLKLRAATEPGSVEIAGSPMPVALPPLSADELTAIRIWIQEGAPETGSVADEMNQVSVGDLLDTCLPPRKPINVRPLEPPAADEGIQFVMPIYPLKAQSEVENCTPFAYDFTERVPPAFKDEARNVMFVNGSRTRQDPQSHHLVLYDLGLDLSELSGDLSDWSCRDGERDGQSCDPRAGSADCGTAGVCADVSVPNSIGCTSVVGFDARQIVNAQAPQEYIPPLEGVYSEIPLRGVIYFNSHAFNLLDEDTVMHARINFYYTDDLRRELYPDTVSDDVFISAGQAPFTRETYCVTTVVPQGHSLVVLAGHTHRRGERFWVFDPQGEMIYENFVYDDPLYQRFDPWLTFDSADPAQRTLEYCTTINNGVTADGSPDVELVTRASRMPERSSCNPIACVAGKVAEACTSNAECDSAPGAGDGFCDACPITGGVTTENEMLVLMPWYVRPEAAN